MDEPIYTAYIQYDTFKQKHTQNKMLHPSIDMLEPEIYRKSLTTMFLLRAMIQFQLQLCKT
jgi:hypothetical protein